MEAYSAFSESDNLLKALRKSANVVFSGLTLPSAFFTLMPNLLIASAASFGGLINLVKVDLKAVPACSPLMPALAIRPIASATSSTLYLREPANGATYLNVYPISPTLVFALLDAAANTSANLPESFADIPNAVSASVTISDTLAKSSPEAAARSIIPLIPFSISVSFQPAIAMYCIA